MFQQVENQIDLPLTRGDLAISPDRGRRPSNEIAIIDLEQAMHGKFHPRARVSVFGSLFLKLSFEPRSVGMRRQSRPEYSR